jgi:hypothetical protein
MKQLARVLFLSLAALTPACGGGAGGDLTPDQAVMAGIQALRANDVEALVTSLASDAQLAELEADWETRRGEEPDAEEALQFETFIQQFTAPGAEQALLASVEPQLAELAPQMGMMIAMMGGMGESAILSNDTLTQEEKEDAVAVLRSAGEALLEADVSSTGNARQAIAILCTAVRGLDLATLDDVRALDLDEVMEKGDVVLAALKDVFEVYGLSADDGLDTFSAETLAQDGDRATVRVHFELLGIDESSDYEMQRVDGRWIRAEAAAPRP